MLGARLSLTRPACCDAVKTMPESTLLVMVNERELSELRMQRFN
jgi:hypothetical protein